MQSPQAQDNRGRPGTSWEPDQGFDISRPETSPMSFLCLLASQRYKFKTREYSQRPCTRACLSHGRGGVGQGAGVGLETGEAWEMN